MVSWVQGISLFINNGNLLFTNRNWHQLNSLKIYRNMHINLMFNVTPVSLSVAWKFYTNVVPTHKEGNMVQVLKCKEHYVQSSLLQYSVSLKKRRKINFNSIPPSLLEHHKKLKCIQYITCAGNTCFYTHECATSVS